MACGCRKDRIPPLGLKKKKTQDATSAPSSPTVQPDKTLSGIGTYELKVSGFKTQTFGSKLEADAARKRMGRGTVEAV